MASVEICALHDSGDPRFESFVDLYGTYLGHFNVSYSPPHIRSLLIRTLSESWFHCLTAEIGNMILGFCVFTNTYSPVHCCLAYTLNDIYIRPGFQGRGYGTALVNAIVRQGQSAGIHKLNVILDREDEKNTRFYRKNGFRDGDACIFMKVF